jgi:hypothetical protein
MSEAGDARMSEAAAQQRVGADDRTVAAQSAAERSQLNPVLG